MLAWACIAPHGSEVIAELARRSPERMAVTRAAMELLGERCRRAAPETIVVYTPHGFCVEGRLSITVSSALVGVLSGDGGARVTVAFRTDAELAEALAEAAGRAGVPIALAAFTEKGLPSRVLELDWGATVPLWFLGARWVAPPSVVVLCPDRSLPRRALVDAGRATVQAARAVGRRIAVVCSADQGHGHAPDGPYGYTPASAVFDAAYCRAVRGDDLRRLLHWRSDRVEAALADSFWQTLMLHGALEGAGLRAELLSYEAPTYFGMACASFEPIGSETDGA
ncbi:MAG: hypothetical protein IT208_01380 [Chthonomonadales bacterium]|nr:hypothetical protein [Chthonomonadales bacterium]